MFDKEWLTFLNHRNKDYFYEYLKLIEAKVTSNKLALKEREAEILATLRTNHPDALDEYDPDDYLSDIAIEQFELEQVVYRSFIVSIFIFIENFASDVCNTLQREEKQLFGYKDIKGTGVGRSITYLEKILGCHPISDPELRERFNIALKVRNAVVHSDGALKKEDLVSIRKFISKNPGMLQESLGDVEITHRYAESLILLSSEFADTLIEKTER